MNRPLYDITASGLRMREIRKARHISVAEVMEYMGFESRQSIYKWEKGKCYPQADNLMALAKLYSVSPTELMVEADLTGSASPVFMGSFVVWIQPLVAIQALFFQL